MSSIKTALVLGATGLVGQNLVRRLLRDHRYQSIRLLVRKPLPSTLFDDPDKKLEVIVIDFEALQDYQGYFTVDHVYCCLGSTMKKAGSKAAFRRVDFEYIHVAAQLARAQRCKSFVWVSSVGADANSKNFYLKVKGELENAIMRMPQLDNAAAVRPSLLLGERNESRPLESLWQSLAPYLAPLMQGRLKKYRPVDADDVAAKMVSLQQF